MEKKNDPQRCTTPLFRVSYPHVYKPNQHGDEKEAKFKIAMLFDKKTDLAPLRKAVFAAKKKEWGPDKADWPKNIASPFYDGNEKADTEGYKNKIVVRAKNKHRPAVIDLDLQPIEEVSGDFYAGCFARARLRAFAYGGKGTGYKPGVAFSFESVQKVKDGDRFGGGGEDIQSVYGEYQDDEADTGRDDEDDSDSDEDGDAGF